MLALRWPEGAQDGLNIAKVGPKIAPGWPKLAPRSAHESPSTHQDGSMCAQVGPKTGEVGPKTAQSRLNTLQSHRKGRSGFIRTYQVEGQSSKKASTCPLVCCAKCSQPCIFVAVHWLEFSCMCFCALRTYIDSYT